MRQVEVYICEYCNDEMTMTTDVEWLKEHELLCEKNPANAELPCHCFCCANSKSLVCARWDHFHKKPINHTYYQCTVENVKCTDKVCLQFVPKTK